MRYIYSLCLLFLASCTTYRSQFDCPPFKGAGCKSVSQIEAMIVETQKGSDYLDFSKAPKKRKLQKKSCCQGFIEQAKNTKVWICPYQDEKGHFIEGHYIHFEKNPNPIGEIERCED